MDAGGRGAAGGGSRLVLTLRHLARAVVPRPVRNWLRAPEKSLRWLTDELRHAVRADVRVTMRPDWTLRCHPAAFRTAFRPLRDDPDQRLELDGFIAACRPRMCLFDLGAHFGVYSLAALHYGGPEAVAVAVDPSPTAVRMLGIQATLNGVAERLRVVCAAVTASTGSVELVAAGVTAAGYYTAPTDHPPGDRSVVPAVTVDGLVRRTRLVPTHLKVDVEGFEGEALEGAHDLLRRVNAPIVFLELHVAMIRERGADPMTPLRHLGAAGYTFADLRGRAVEPMDTLQYQLVRLHALPPALEAA